MTAAPDSTESLSLDLSALKEGYRSGSLRPSQIVASVLRTIDAAGANPVWISRVAPEALHARAKALEGFDRASLPLYGIPFAVKDNIDVADMLTTAGCPAFARIPSRHATVVQKLLDAGAMLVGKTNLDQFATGLTGTRSPYGACRNSFDPAFISGGSSSGSAVAVAMGMASFALGTDTAGSGRVPAALNNIVGLKPSRGIVSAAGVVPACRSLDCVSIFALTVADACEILDVAGGTDAGDPYSREAPVPARLFPAAFRFGVPRASQLEFFGDRDAGRHFDSALSRMREIGGTQVEIDYEPFRDAGNMLYGGPWAAERYAGNREFLDTSAHELLPVTRQIIMGAAKYAASDAFLAMYQLKRLERTIAPVWRDVDFVLLPTTPTIYRIEEVEADPVGLNSRLGTYTNFVNLLDLCGIAVPSGIRADGLPAGVTLIGPAFTEEALAGVAARFHAAVGGTMGATGKPLRAAALPSGGQRESASVELAVVGAHLSGGALNHQLTRRGATLLRTCRTAPSYRLYALPGTAPAKPGLRRTVDGGHGIEVEVWSLGLSEFGEFTAEVPPPLGIGTVVLEDGAEVKGFICECHALEGAQDITQYGGWRNYLAQSRQTALRA